MAPAMVETLRLWHSPGQVAKAALQETAIIHLLTINFLPTALCLTSDLPDAGLSSPALSVTRSGMAAPAPIQELVERFKASRDPCRSAACNEEQCRATIREPCENPTP